MSYIEDVEEGDGICRIYGFSDDNLNLDALANKGYDWFTKSELQIRLGESDATCRAIDTWQQSEYNSRQREGVQSKPNPI